MHVFSEQAKKLWAACKALWLGTAPRVPRGGPAVSRCPPPSRSGERTRPSSRTGPRARSLTRSRPASGLPVPALPHAHFVTLDTRPFLLGLFQPLQNGHDPCPLGSEEEVREQVTPEAVRQKGERREELGELRQGPGGSPH